eukprot:CAMPEP_0168485650 /NCGR_PEP_ID=MMETSP0228-20121227/66717_1 /TAXON_ID=133427 /ORGANISM="Protoceratium reticulatum, Strain CCCM 535 (=CCMP 1889)" /LENGTH=244 /DNA_ID=CAMNT_0008502217 /DNA_START=127 /DNA_END=858 /DNA_ORIENTATION=-
MASASGLHRPLARDRALHNEAASQVVCPPQPLSVPRVNHEAVAHCAVVDHVGSDKVRNPRWVEGYIPVVHRPAVRLAVGRVDAARILEVELQRASLRRGPVPAGHERAVRPRARAQRVAPAEDLDPDRYSEARPVAAAANRVAAAAVVEPRELGDAHAQALVRLAVVELWPAVVHARELRDPPTVRNEFLRGHARGLREGAPLPAAEGQVHARVVHGRVLAGELVVGLKLLLQRRAQVVLEPGQ